jgi:hypothetical protein
MEPDESFEGIMLEEPTGDSADLLFCMLDEEAAPNPIPADERLMACPFCHRVFTGAKPLEAYPAGPQGISAWGNPRKKSPKEGIDDYGILCFAAGVVSLFFLPWVFMPACFLSGMASEFGPKRNYDFQGSGLRTIGMVLGTISLVWLLWTHQVGLFAR